MNNFESVLAVSIAAVIVVVAICLAWYHVSTTQAAIAAGLVEVPNPGTGGTHWAKP